MAKYDNDTWEALKQYFKEQIYFTTFEDADLSFKIAIIDSRGFQLWYLQRKVKELQNLKIYLDVDLGTPVTVDKSSTESITQAFQLSLSSDDETTPYTILEQHTYLDLDNDDYAEPYIVTVDLDSRKVLRIVPRFN